MSEITGEGYGRSHDWERGPTEFRATLYRCRKCNAVFVHDYPRIPEIGKAMAFAGIVDKCPGVPAR